MHSKTRRSRLGAIAIVVGSILSIGAASGSVSAEQQTEDTKVSVISTWDGRGGGATSMRSGIRW